MPGDMEFCLLGPLTVRRGDAELPLRRGHERSLLAALLLAAGHMLSVDAIAEVLWQAEPPPSAPVSIRHYVWQLRLALGEQGPQRIVSRPGGYLMRVGDGELDLTRFERLLASARASAASGSWDQAAALAQESLALWRGEPLADIDSQALALREAPRLAELRLQAAEIRLEAGLCLGRHAEAAADLARLAAEQPLREHVHALLMLALYRSGRQADALIAYQRLRACLVEELGTEPGAELQSLHQRILAVDPSLDLARRTSARPATGPGPGPASTTSQPARVESGRAVPRQLPAPVDGFAGRAAELRTLTEMLGKSGGKVPGTVVISAIGGTAGVGKTALAVHWARQHLTDFPDGQLYVNLRGYGPASAPVAPADALRRLIEGLGITPDKVPATCDAREALYRSLLADQKILIVLDNARNAAQVRPLLPGSPGPLVLITSRSDLAGLVIANGARPLVLDVLSPADARDLLARRLGPASLDAEPAAAAQLTALCARLPLALAITAARAASRPRFPLAALAAELADARHRLDALSTGEDATSVRSVFSWSYHSLGPDGARMFRLLGIHPGPDITPAAAASLAACDRASAHAQLRELARHHLLTEHAPGRYAFHDLLRAYAAEQAAAGKDTDRSQAIRRVLDHYLHTARTANELIGATRTSEPAPGPSPGVTPELLAGHQQALAWFHSEHHTLIAAVRLAIASGHDDHIWQIPRAMAEFLNRSGYWDEAAGILRTALATATRTGSLPGQAITHRLLARILTRLGDYDEAHVNLTESIALYRRLADRVGEASAHQNASVACERQGRYADALSHAEQALALARAAGDRGSQAAALNDVGWFSALVGRYQQARDFCEQSVLLHTELGKAYGQARSWDSLGYVEQRLCNLGRAADCYRRALRLIRDVGSRFYEAEVLTHLGDTYEAAGEPEPARASWQQALAILDDLHHPDATQIHDRLRKLVDDGHGARPR